MSLYTEIMDEMADTIRELIGGGVDGVDVQVEPRRVFNPSPPTVDIFPGDIFADPDTAGFGEPDQPTFTVRVRVATGDSYAGQDLLLALMDPEHELSVEVALAADPTLNGMASSIDIAGQSGWTAFDDGFGALLGYQWRVLVIRAYS